MLPAFSQSCYDVISEWMGLLPSDRKCEIDVLPFLQNLTRDEEKRYFSFSKLRGTLS